MTDTIKRIDLTRRSALGSQVAAMLAAVAAPVLAQQRPYPNRPIKIIMPWVAGGGGDVIARLMAPSLSQRLDQRSYQSFYTGEFDRSGQYIRTAKVMVDQ